MRRRFRRINWRNICGFPAATSPRRSCCLATRAFCWRSCRRRIGSTCSCSAKRSAARSAWPRTKKSRGCSTIANGASCRRSGRLYGLPTVLEDAISPDATMVFETHTHVEAIRLKCSDYERLERPRPVALRTACHAERGLRTTEQFQQPSIAELKVRRHIALYERDGDEQPQHAARRFNRHLVGEARTRRARALPNRCVFPLPERDRCAYPSTSNLSISRAVISTTV